MKKMLSWVLTAAMLMGLCPALSIDVRAESEEFTITFVDNYGHGDPYTQTYHVGETIELEPNRFARSGFIFYRWYDAEQRTMYEDCAKLTFHNGKDVTLCANWTASEGNLSGGARWDISDTGVLTIHGGNVYGGYSTTWPWTKASSHVRSIVISEKVVAHGDLNFMFSGFQNITSLDLSQLDTTNATSMTHMFASCSNLEELNLDGFNTSNVINMAGLFFGCPKLKALNLSSFDTSKVLRMDSMFEGCKALSSLNITGFNTSNVEKMNSMFSGCENLVALDLKNFNTGNTSAMGGNVLWLQQAGALRY